MVSNRICISMFSFIFLLITFQSIEALPVFKTIFVISNFTGTGNDFQTKTTIADFLKTLEVPKLYDTIFPQNITISN